ncbi:MAG: hypothetical protein ACHRXM_37995 [Isosphaerales bacterium]
MPVLFHGTNRPLATAMAGTPALGTIDVLTRGHGEFGRGFYTQGSISNAFRRGYSRFGNNNAVLVLTVDAHAYHALNFKRLTLNGAQMLDAKLKGKARRTFATAHDVIVGPLVGLPSVEQQKFQTQNAQDLLNGLLTQRAVRP